MNSPKTLQGGARQNTECVSGIKTSLQTALVESNGESNDLAVVGDLSEWYKKQKKHFRFKSRYQFLEPLRDPTSLYAFTLSIPHTPEYYKGGLGCDQLLVSKCPKGEIGLHDTLIETCWRLIDVLALVVGLFQTTALLVLLHIGKNQ